MAELKGAGTVVQVAQQPCQHGPEQQTRAPCAGARVKGDAKEDSKDTIVVGRLGKMNLWLWVHCVNLA